MKNSVLDPSILFIVEQRNLNSCLNVHWCIQGYGSGRKSSKYTRPPKLARTRINKVKYKRKRNKIILKEV